MPVNYNVNPLGGFDVGAELRGLGQQFGQQREQEALKQRRESLQNDIRMASGGDVTAMDNLMGKNPDLAIMIQDRNRENEQRLGAERAAIVKDATTDFAMRFINASDEDKVTLVQEAEANPDIDFDREDAQQQGDFAARALIYENKGKDFYKTFLGGGEGSEKGTYNTKITPTGVVRTNSATGKIDFIQDSSKISQDAKKQEKVEFDKQLKQSNTDFQRSKEIRNRYDKKSGEFIKVRDAFGRIEVSAKDPSPAGDLSLIFNYMKMLDPGSTVREGEFATAAGAASVPERFKGAYKKVVSGEMLTTGQRKDFVSRSNALMGRAKSQNKKDRAEAIRLAKQWNVTEQDIFGQQELSDEDLVSKYDVQ